MPKTSHMTFEPFKYYISIHLWFEKQNCWNLWCDLWFEQDDKGRWWPALGMFWGAKITAYIFTILVFYHPNLLIFWAFWTILIFGWFWLLENLEFLFLENFGWFHFGTILIFGRYWFFDSFDFLRILDNFDFWIILTFGQFDFLEHFWWFYFGTIFIFGQYLFFDDFDLLIILIFWKFWFFENLDFWKFCFFLKNL